MSIFNTFAGQRFEGWTCNMHESGKLIWTKDGTDDFILVALPGDDYFTGTLVIFKYKETDFKSLGIINTIGFMNFKEYSQAVKPFLIYLNTYK